MPGHADTAVIERIDACLEKKEGSVWTWGDLFKGLFWISPLGGILAPERQALMQLIRARDTIRQGALPHSDSHKD
jgi:hypothetical protein